MIDVASLLEIQGEDESHVYAGEKTKTHSWGLLRRHIRILRSLNAKAPEAFELGGSAGFLKKKKREL